MQSFIDSTQAAKVCYNPENRPDTPLVCYIFLGVVTCMCIVVSFFWYRLKESFPIKQRSTYLTFAILVCCYIHLVLQPILILYLQYIYDLNPSNMQPNPDNPELMLWTVGNAFYYFQIFYQILSFCFPSLYYLRTIRLWYAFNTKMTSKFWRTFFLNQSTMILSCILVTIVFSLLPLYFLTDNILMPIQYYNDAKVWSSAFEYFRQIQFYLVAYMIYLMRNVRQQYAIKTELIIILISLLPWQMLVLVYPNIDSGCEIATWFNLVVYMWRNIALILFGLVLPMVYSTRVRIPMPPELILHDFYYFINDKTCLNIFTQFLIFLDQHEQKLNKNINHDSTFYIQRDTHQQFLRFWLDYSMIQFNLNKESVDYLLQQYFTENALDLDDSELGFIQLPTDNENCHQITDSLERIHEITFKLLEKVYRERFQKTFSHQVLSNRFQYFEQAYKNLLKLNMTITFDQSSIFNPIDTKEDEIIDNNNNNQLNK